MSSYVIYHQGNETIGISEHARRRMEKRFYLLHPNHTLKGNNPPDWLQMIKRMYIKHHHKLIDFGDYKYIPCGEYGLYLRDSMITTVVIRQKKHAYLNAA